MRLLISGMLPRILSLLVLTWSWHGATGVYSILSLTQLVLRIGEVKIHDTCKAATDCVQRHGLPTLPIERPPVPPPIELPRSHTSLKPHLIRAPRTKAMESLYSEHARDRFIYWYEERKKLCGECRENYWAFRLLANQARSGYVTDTPKVSKVWEGVVPAQKRN